VVVFNTEAMQLQNQLFACDQPFILWTSVGALAVEQALVPETARFDVGGSYQGLRAHQI
jgi:hypothetical protein